MSGQINPNDSTSNYSPRLLQPIKREPAELPMPKHYGEMMMQLRTPDSVDDSTREQRLRMQRGIVEFALKTVSPNDPAALETLKLIDEELANIESKKTSEGAPQSDPEQQEPETQTGSRMDTKS